MKLVLLAISIALYSSCAKTSSVSGMLDQNIHLNQSGPRMEEKKEIDYFSHLKPEHEEILRIWLKDKSSLRPAVDAKNVERRGVGKGRQKRQSPFYVVADFNKDGKEDFAVVLVNVSLEDRFSIAIFNGGTDKSPSPNLLQEGLHGLSNAQISYVNVRDDYFASDSFLFLDDERGCVGFIPHNNNYKTVVCI
jgi:hypothetical protein